MSLMPIAIRCAVLDDMPAILEIGRRAPMAPRWTCEQFARLVGNGVVLVAKDVAEVRGFICANALSNEWEIENIVVDAEFLRRGIADALLRALIQRAKNEAASAILLDVRESNLPARRLYEKYAFRELGRRRMYYKDPLEDAILYTLSLDR
jgi:ribosomal-protein-alanine N-acetyltransferase